MSEEVLSREDTETLYLGTIRDNSVVFPTWLNVQLLSNNDEVSFKLEGYSTNRTVLPIHW